MTMYPTDAPLGRLCLAWWRWQARSHRGLRLPSRATLLRVLSTPWVCRLCIVLWALGHVTMR